MKIEYRFTVANDREPSDMMLLIRKDKTSLRTMRVSESSMLRINFLAHKPTEIVDLGDANMFVYHLHTLPKEK